MSISALELQPASLKPGAAIRIIPAGYFRTKDGRPSGQITDWHLDATIAAALIAALAISGASYVIDYEHQTIQKEKNGQPAPAAGWFKSLEWREGEGLFMKDIEWTERARQMIGAGEYRYLSPVFKFNPTTGDVTALHSVALTNDPALVGLTDLAAATAALTGQPGGQVEQQMTEEERAKFLHVFGELPGFSEATGLHRPEEPGVSRADLAAMTDQERANFLHVFGDSIVSS